MRLVYVLALLPVTAMADGWERLDGAEITAALTDRTLVYDEYTLQHFRSDGATQFITERASDGRWAVRGEQYCSVWPPSDVWACYDVERDGEMVRFIGSDRSVSTGSFAE